MAKKNKLLFLGIIGLIGMIFVGIIGFASFSLLKDNSLLSGSSEKPKKYWHECNIIVNEKLIGTSTYINSLTCSNTGSTCGSLFSLFQGSGDIEVWDNSGKIASKSFETGLLSGESKITVQACSTGQDLKIKLYDENHNLIQEKSA